MPSEPQLIEIPRMTQEEIRDRAEEFRLRNWDGKIPIDVELIADRDLNIQLIPIPDLSKLTSADAFLSGCMTEIAFDPLCHENRLRFSIGEEIGHFVLHSEQIQKLRSHYDSKANWMKIISELGNALWARADYQAKEFAGRLLVPKEELINCVLEYEHDIEKANESLGRNILLREVYQYISSAIGKKFKVSGMVIEKRLERENISQEISFLRNLS